MRFRNTGILEIAIFEIEFLSLKQAAKNVIHVAVIIWQYRDIKYLPRRHILKP